MGNSERLHRSSWLERRCFRQPGQLHLHVDARDLVFLHSLIADLEGIVDFKGKKIGVKLNEVAESVIGEAWTEAAFGQHGSSGKGKECFLSAALTSRPQCIEAIRILLSRIHDIHGVVLEVERVVARWSWRQGNETADYGVVPRISSEEAEYPVAKTCPVEVHACFEVVQKRAPFELGELEQKLASNEGLRVGTWSRFEREEGVWSYRSTDFAYEFHYERHCAKDYENLKRFLGSRKVKYRELWVIAEEVLGLWKAPVERITSPDEFVRGNRVPLKDVVKINKDAVPEFSKIIQTKETEGNDCELKAERVDELVKHVSCFEEIATELQLRPLLLELAVTQEWGSLEPKKFASVMVSYPDSSLDPHLLRAWQGFILHVTQSSESGINPVSPVIFHPETYNSGYLFERFDWIVEGAYHDLFPGGRGIRSAREALEQSGLAASHTSGSEEPPPLRSAALKRYTWENPIENPAPVRQTLTILCRRVVKELMGQLREARTTGEPRGVLDTLASLAKAWLIVVPFRWKTRAEEQKSTPGGCVFAVVSPEDETAGVTSRDLQDLAVRFGWVLFRATLEDVYVGDLTVPKQKFEPWTLSDAQEVRTFILRLREALGRVQKFEDKERIRSLRLQVPGLSGIEISPHELKGDYNPRVVGDALTEEKFGLDMKTIHRRLKDLGFPLRRANAKRASPSW